LKKLKALTFYQSQDSAQFHLEETETKKHYVDHPVEEKSSCITNKSIFTHNGKKMIE